MAKTRTRTRKHRGSPKPKHRARHRRNPANPSAAAANPRRRRRRNNQAANPRRRRRRNPGNPGVQDAFGMIQRAALLIAGAVGTRAITQAVLGSKNAGFIGYIGNAAVAIGLGVGTHQLTKNRLMTEMVTFGGFVSLTLRLLADFTPFGRQLALMGLGDYQVSTIFSPVRYVNPTTGAVVDIPTAVRPMLPPPPLPAAPAAMAGLGATSTYSRRNSTY